MHIIDPRWTDLAAGYRAVLAGQARLEKEFGRAVRVGRERKFRKELTDWQKKRRVFIALAIIAPLSVVGLCLAAYFFRDVACVIVYWIMVVLIILVALAVAGRNFLREMANRPERERVEGLAVDLEWRWWNSLAPKEIQAVKVKKVLQSPPDFLASLQSYPLEGYASLRRPPDASEAVLVGPSGIWAFQVRTWDGTIAKQGGTWRLVRTVRDRLGRKKAEETVHTPGPDEEWLAWKKRLLQVLQERLPQAARTPDLLQGGVAFSFPGAVLDKNRIQGNTAAYGPVGAWAQRIRKSPLQEDFPPEVQLQALEALRSGSADGVPQPASAEAEAERLYQEAVQELRSSVADLVKD